MGTLQICKRPQCIELHTSAFPLSILNVHPNFSEKFLLQNFIPIAFEKRFGNVITYDLPLFWFWDCFEFHISFHYPMKDVIKSIQKKIDNQYYVFICINEKYVPNRVAFNNYDFNHEVLIYGYNKDEQVFNTIAYNKNYIYDTEKIPMNIICSAFLKDKIEHYFKFYAIKVKDDYKFDTLDIHKLKKDIKNYLNPRSSKKGINAFSFLEKEMNKKKIEKKTIDLRSLKTLSDRANLFMLFLRYFHCDEKTCEIINTNIKMAFKSIYLSMKYNNNKNHDVFNSVMETVALQKELEKNILQRVYNNL